MHMTDVLPDYTNLKQLIFRRLEERYDSLINQFQSSNRNLKDYLVEDALRDQNLCVSTTRLVFDSVNFRKGNKMPSKLILLGYVTITNDSISLNGDLKSAFRGKGIDYKALPAMKIGRLCVDDRYKKRHIGKLILLYCIRKAVYLNQNAACRFITLDAKRNPQPDKDSLHFYRRYGFDVLPHKDRNKDELMRQQTGETPMYMDIYHIAKKALKLKDVD